MLGLPLSQKGGAQLFAAVPHLEVVAKKKEGLAGGLALEEKRLTQPGSVRVSIGGWEPEEKARRVVTGAEISVACIAQNTALA